MAKLLIGLVLAISVNIGADEIVFQKGVSPEGYEDVTEAEIRSVHHYAFKKGQLQFGHDNYLRNLFKFGSLDKYIPKDAKIEGGELVLFMERSHGMHDFGKRHPLRMDLFRMRKPWNDRADWDYTGTGGSWFAGGGGDDIVHDIFPAPEVKEGLVVSKLPDLKKWFSVPVSGGTIQKWVKDPASNLGWIMAITKDAGDPGGVGWLSSVNDDKSKRPKLIIRFQKNRGGDAPLSPDNEFDKSAEKAVKELRAKMTAAVEADLKGGTVIAVSGVKNIRRGKEIRPSRWLQIGAVKKGSKGRDTLLYLEFNELSKSAKGKKVKEAWVHLWFGTYHGWGKDLAILAFNQGGGEEPEDPDGTVITNDQVKSPYGWNRIKVKAETVQKWIDDPSINKGLLLRVIGTDETHGKEVKGRSIKDRWIPMFVSPKGDKERGPRLVVKTE